MRTACSGKYPAKLAAEIPWAIQPSTWRLPGSISQALFPARLARLALEERWDRRKHSPLENPSGFESVAQATSISRPWHPGLLALPKLSTRPADRSHFAPSVLLRQAMLKNRVGAKCHLAGVLADSPGLGLAC